MRHGLLASDYREMKVTGAHAITAARLPPIHKETFDRMLVAQARAERATLLAMDVAVVRYGAPVRLVRLVRLVR